MGYILPVTSYQYNQYAEREIGTKYDPFRFVPVAKISAQSNSKDFRHELPLDIQRRLTRSNLQQRVDIQKQSTRKKAEKTFGELTGNGLYISEYI
ncbi:hypothetical protein AF332_22980 [Sporosarcina globispora]|uniref:Uncharacterized protein n=1 Tax=Sporosarcina globispora TaxID=1459 RepID=A0A0M0GIT7_SPOGL|nr:hypothetical protein [Sporosarcina globispora]KON89392.1 hypothetical protein AF332_22980 [Sporosarcina globispora]